MVEYSFVARENKDEDIYMYRIKANYLNCHSHALHPSSTYKVLKWQIVVARRKRRAVVCSVRSLPSSWERTDQRDACLWSFNTDGFVRKVWSCTGRPITWLGNYFASTCWLFISDAPLQYVYTVSVSMYS
jgi:hypothetical protein